MVVEIRGNMGGKKESEHCEVERAEGFEEKGGGGKEAT
jgi:hypothetical protein